MKHHTAWAAAAQKIAKSAHTGFYSKVEEHEAEVEPGLEGQAKTERDWDKAQCTWYGLNAASWLTDAILKMRAAALLCPKDGQYRCAVNVVYLFAALGYASQFMNEMAEVCPFHGHREALCGADISETVASFLFAGMGAVTVLDDCAKTMNLKVPPPDLPGPILALR